MAQLPENVVVEMSSGTKRVEESYLEGTMSKVFHALVKSGLNRDQALDGLTEMQNAGILFRERFKL